MRAARSRFGLFGESEEEYFQNGRDKTGGVRPTGVMQSSFNVKIPEELRRRCQGRRRHEADGGCGFANVQTPF